MALLREQKTRPFILEIETDSTIQPDEDAAKQRASEFITAVGGYMQQAVASVSMVPQMAPLAAEMLKYVASQFRAGRAVDGAIDEFADQMKQMASQPKPPPPEQVKAEADAKAAEAKAASDAQEAQHRQGMEQQAAATEQVKAQSEAETAQVENAERMQALQSKAADDDQKRRIAEADAAAKAKRDAEMATIEREIKNVQLATAKIALAKAAVDAVTPQPAPTGPDGQPGKAPPTADMDEIADILSTVASTDAPASKRHAETSQSLAAVVQGQAQIAAALTQVAASLARPRSVTTPSGRTYTAQVN